MSYSGKLMHRVLQFVCIQMCHTAQFGLLAKLYSNYPRECRSIAINLHKPIACEKIFEAGKKIVMEISLERASYIMSNCLSKTDKGNCAKILYMLDETDLLKLFTSWRARLAAGSLMMMRG